MFKKRNKYNITNKAANEALQNVFAACDQKPNDTPLEVIKVWSFANTVIVKVGLYMSLGLLVAVLLMPLAFRNSKTGGIFQKNNEVSVESHYLDADTNEFVMVLTGDGIDYSGIYARVNNGRIVFPTLIDEDSHTVKIPFTEGNLNIYVPKMDGTIMQAVLSK